MSTETTTPPTDTTQPFMGPIALTDSAARQFRRLMEKENKQNFGIRAAVQGGGCSGMNYYLDLEEKPADGDKVFESQGLRIFCDMKSWFYLRNMTIDYKDDLLMGGFTFHNPNAKSTCGCGTSFSA